MPTRTRVKCQKCRKVSTLDRDDLSIEELYSNERSMGLEIAYGGEIEFPCPKCGNNIEVMYEAYEYPAGSLNHSDTTARGATVIEGFEDIDVSFQEELYSFEEDVLQDITEEQNGIALIKLKDSAEELIEYLANNPEQLYEVDPRKFEEIIAHIFSNNNFTVDLTEKTRDGGRDIIAIRSDLGVRSKYIIECKRYARNNPISVGLVRNLFGVQQQEGANKSILAATSRFTKEAKEFAHAKNTTEWLMDLKGYEHIVAWIQKESRKKSK